MKRVVSHERAHAARGSDFLLLRQKKVTKEKANPTFAPWVRIARFEAKTSRGPKLAALKQRTASSTFPLQISGANGRGPLEPMFDRSAMRFTGTRMQTSALHFIQHFLSMTCLL